MCCLQVGLWFAGKHVLWVCCKCIVCRGVLLAGESVFAGDSGRTMCWGAWTFDMCCTNSHTKKGLHQAGGYLALERGWGVNVRVPNDVYMSWGDMGVESTLLLLLWRHMLFDTGLPQACMMASRGHAGNQDVL